MDRGLATLGSRELTGVERGALLRAQALAITDIPYARKIFDIVSKQFPDETFDSQFAFAPRWEACHKLVDMLIDQFFVEAKMFHQFEIGCGYSPRCLGWEPLEPRQVHYAMIDRHEVIEVMKDLISTLEVDDWDFVFPQGTFPTQTDLWEVVRGLKRTWGMAVITEGLLQYYTHEEKGLLADNIKRTCLLPFGNAVLGPTPAAVWVTPDIVTRDMVARFERNLPGTAFRISDRKLSNMLDNSFVDIDEARDFFEDHGLHVRVVHVRPNVEQLSSFRVLGIERDHIEAITGDIVAFVMTPKFKKFPRG